MSATPISINGSALAVQPSDLTEMPIAIQTDNTAVDGSMQRNYINQKWSVTMGFTYLTPAQVQLFNTLFLSGTPVTYLNTSSNQNSGGSLTFSGLPTFTFGKYFNGAGLLVPYQVTIRQV
jgi:hypothetical protein